MSELMDVFEAIDVDYSGIITYDELFEYMNKNGYEHEFIEQILSNFDTNNSGQISLDEYCNVFGISPSEDYIDKVKLKKGTLETYSNRSNSPLPTNNVEVIRVDDKMDSTLQNAIFQASLQAQRDNTTERDIARSIKATLDKDHGRAWHVVVCRGNYGSVFSHEPGFLIHFQTGSYSIQAWRTPEF